MLECEKILGLQHIDTFRTRYWLALTQYGCEKYSDVRKLLQQSIQEREEMLGQNHFETVRSRHWLARTLYVQKEYIEAEVLLRQSVNDRAQMLGQEHLETLESRHWLARTLHEQGRHSEAEEIFLQVTHGQDKVLGREHSKTLESRHWQADTCYKQRKYSEAEQLLEQVMQGREKVLGAEHKDTKDSRSLLQETLRAIRTLRGGTNATGIAILGRLGELFEDKQRSNAKYSDPEISQISSLLKHSNPRWSRVPRTYVILRTIGYLNLLDEFIDLGFSDYWFPVTERNLPGCLHPSHRLEFIAVQELVLTKSIGLEKGEDGQHAHFRRHEPLPFEEKGVLGSGGFGQVDKVLSLVSFREYARKRVSRRQVFGGRGTEEMKQLVAEIAILKRLKHRHVVELLGSYTDPKYIGLIMSPVADMDLSTYLAQADVTRHGELRTFFGCLARGLEFLHEQKIRHKDIKPGNILVHGGNILFTDFGLSADFADADGSNTFSMVNGITPRYCAPEVALFEPRNTASDIWSLGVVFLEMTAVLKGKAVEFIQEFLKGHGSKQAFVRTNPAALTELVAILQTRGQMSDDQALEWCRQMLQIEQQLRPTAVALTASIIGAQQPVDGNRTFCGICCISLDDESTDASSDDI